MQIQFLGAARQVTGSQYYLKTGGAKILIDCGMFQEHDFLERNWSAPAFRASDLDAVLLTHAHIDHCGLLPKLVEQGFRGPIFATSASVDLVSLVLRDSAAIQREDAKFKRKRHRKERRRGKFPERPLYTLRDVEQTIQRLEPVPYELAVPITRHVSVAFHDAGHILGSAMLEVVSQEKEGSRRLVFSGDMGQAGKPFVRDPAQLTRADYIVVESTYGDRTHDNPDAIERQLSEVINRTVENGGKVIIPIFAIERAQELLYYLGRLVRSKGIPSLPVYLDSPMAASVNEIFRRHRDCLAPQGQEQIESEDMLLAFRGMVTVQSVEQSKAINHKEGPAVILAANGMCTAGRIKHHLAQYIDRPECTILFVGYQAQGTLGRQILDGNKEVRLHGRSRLVRARIERIAGFSGHADRAALLAWLGHFVRPPKRLFVTHGEVESSLAMAEEIRNRLHWNVTVPEYRQTVELG